MSILSDALKKTDKEYRKNKRDKLSDIDVVSESPQKRKKNIWVVIVPIGIILMAVGFYLIATGGGHQNMLPQKAPAAKPIAKTAANVKAAEPAKKVQTKAKKPEAVAPQKPTMQLVKKPSIEAIKAQLYRQSIGLLQLNKIDQLENLLSKFSDNKVVFVSTVSRLSDAMLVSNEYQKAANVLNFARGYFPSEKQFVLPLASANMGLMEYQKVLDILSHQSPVLQENPEFYALKALAYLRLKAFSQSKDIYTALTGSFPNNEDYALGLAVSYQGLKQNKMALLMYKQISQNAPVGWGSLPFVREQITRLGQ